MICGVRASSLAVIAGRVAVVWCATSAAAAPARAAPTPGRPPPAEVRTLATPQLVPSSRTFVAFAGKPAEIRLSWQPVPGATRYRARWSSAGTDQDLDVASTTFAYTEPTAGHHQLAVVAIDDTGAASAPAEVAVEVVTVAAIPAGAIAPLARPLDVPAAFTIGAAFSSPGLRCRLGAAPPGVPGGEVIAAAPGAHLLQCGGGPGEPSVEVPVVIAPVLVRAQLAPLPRTRTTLVHVTVASVGALGDQLELAAEGELDLGEAERTTGGIDLPITPLASATTAGLIVRARGIELGRVAVDLTAPPPREVSPAPGDGGSQLAWFALDVGGMLGAFVPPGSGPSSSILGHPTSLDDVLAGGPTFGVRLGLFPTRRVGIELESALATLSYGGRLGVAPVWLNRLQLAARLVEERRFGLRAVLGPDLLSNLTTAGTNKAGSVGGLHYGAAFSVETRPGVSVRFELLDVITVAEDAGFAHCLEVQVGVVTRLGRRDRWK